MEYLTGPAFDIWAIDSNLTLLGYERESLGARTCSLLDRVVRVVHSSKVRDAVRGNLYFEGFNTNIEDFSQSSSLAQVGVDLKKVFVAACDPRIASVFEGMHPLGRLDLKVLQGVPSTVSSGKSDKCLFFRGPWFVLFCLFCKIFCKHINFKKN